MKIEQKTITSLEVAEMMETEHYKIIRKLEGDKDRKGYIEIMTNSQMGASEFFTESTYIDGSGKQNKCYLITKLGCDFLANKFTGEKGILFTARYVKKFRDMEEVLLQPKTEMEILELQFKVLKEVNTKVDAVNDDLQSFKLDMPILGIEETRITSAVKSKGVKCLGGKNSNAYQDRKLRGKVYADIYGQLKREFGVTSYKAIKRNQTDKAIAVIDGYSLPIILQDEIDGANAQLVM